MIHYVHQLVANFARLLFGAEEIAYSSFFIRALLQETAAWCGQSCQKMKPLCWHSEDLKAESSGGTKKEQLLSHSITDSSFQQKEMLSFL